MTAIGIEWSDDDFSAARELEFSVARRSVRQSDLAYLQGLIRRDNYLHQCFNFAVLSVKRDAVFVESRLVPVRLYACWLKSG